MLHYGQAQEGRVNMIKDWVDRRDLIFPEKLCSNTRTREFPIFLRCLDK